MRDVMERVRREWEGRCSDGEDGEEKMENETESNNLGSEKQKEDAHLCISSHSSLFTW